MQTRTITSTDELDKIRTPWEELHSAAHGTLFQHPQWLSTWWEVYGPSRDLKVVTLWQDGLLAGIYPAFADEKSVAGVRFRRLSLLGEIDAYGEYDPLVRHDLMQEAGVEAARYFLGELRRGSIDVIDFHGFPPESAAVRSFLHALRGGTVVRYVPENQSHVIIGHHADGEAFFRTLSPGRRRGLKRDRKGIADEGAEYETVCQWDKGVSFADLVGLHAARWASAGQQGRTGNRMFTRFLGMVTERLMMTGNARLHFVRYKDVRIAGSLVLNMYRRHYGYLNGRDPTHALMRYSVGDALSLRVMMDAFTEGCDCFDMMGGAYQYKQFSGTESRWYARATVIADGFRGVKSRAYLSLLALRDAMHRV
jgi:CelD/BcsL family acetyltransferase involved in cellulose biosynthesis